ncbi:MAG: uL15 family ribosomal protein [Candidatus Nomurabacteria bacterium]|nr:uL15 family ribosomal protein [Candidatus Nomurabacteria bacterium]
MQIHTLKRIHKNKKDRMVGRGGKHAKTSGRGTKGQSARAGNKKRPELRDIIKKLPKLRGYRFKAFRAPALVTAEKASASIKDKKISFKEIRKNLGIKGKKIKIK